jgi:hypothetical protein
MARSPNAVPGALNLQSLTGAETIAMQGGPREAQAMARQVAAAALEVQNIADTTYTFVLGDAGGAYKRTTSTSAITLTVPLNEDVDFPVGAQLMIEQGGSGSGVFTLVGDGSVTLNSVNGLKSSGQYAVVTLLQTDADVWTVFGSTTT